MSRDYQKDASNYKLFVVKTEIGVTSYYFRGYQDTGYLSKKKKIGIRYSLGEGGGGLTRYGILKKK